MHDNVAISTSSTAMAVATALPGEQVEKQDMHENDAYYLPIQRKLSIGDVDDPLEDEADQMADTVMRMPETNFIQRKCAHCEEEEKVQRKPLSSFIQKKGNESGAVADTAISNEINTSRGNGQGMDIDTRSFMENRFAADFSNVTIHTDSQSTSLNRELNAKAFTTGNDIYFNEGQYQPGSDSGRHLLAHELTHTIQQGYSSSVVQRKPGDDRFAKLFEKCMNQKDGLLPSVGLLAHMHRDAQLDAVLGWERPLMEHLIQKDIEARKFVCEAGVPAMVALYDTLNAHVKLEVDCARNALAQHPQHYQLSVMNQKRDKTIPVGHTSFTTFTEITPAKGKPFKLDPGRQIRILAEDKTANTFLVRVISGPQHCEEGIIKKNTVMQATQSSLTGIEKLTLVFFQNPERLGTDVAKVRSAEATKATTLRIDVVGKDKAKTISVPKGSHMTVDVPDLHTDTEFSVEVKFDSGKKIRGFIPKTDVKVDTEFRTTHRRFFVRDIGVDLAKKKKSIFVEIPSQLCSPEHLPIEYFTGRDILNGILTAAHCTGKLVSEVHIIGHAGPHGMGGTGNVTETNGIYVNQKAASLDQFISLTVGDLAKESKAALSNDVRFWLHACSTADDYDSGPGFAEQLASSLIKDGGHSGASVAGLHDNGPANKGIEKKHPFKTFPSKKNEWWK